MRTSNRLLAIVPSTLLAASLVSAAGSLSVQGRNGVPVEMPLRHTRVSIEVTAFVARATIEQEFVNPFEEPVEAIYTFPLGNRAAVDDFELVVGDRTIRGEIKRREEAQEIYERGRAAGFQAALLEQERPNTFTQSVANLEPKVPITIRLRTVEILRYERGAYSLTFPLVIAPRYVPAGSVAESERITAPTLDAGTRSGHDVAITVAIDAGVPLTNLESPSHKTVVMKSSARGATVRLADDDTIPNKDFILRWSVGSEKPAVGLLAHRDGVDGFFTLLVQPKGEVGPAEAMPKEITFVVDTSGSMSGIPIEASKRFAAKALGSLGPRDTFNLIRFADGNQSYSKDPLPNERLAIASALAWLNGRLGEGGTEMLPALEAAFAHPADPNRLRVVVFLTDGQVGNDDEILAAVGKVIGDARIYTVGIGTSVNHHLLDRMAQLGRGAYLAVRPDERADAALETFRSWVTRPYLTDLSIDWGALPIADVAPEKLRDLGSGQTLTLVGRYLAAGEGDVVVRGKLGGRYWEQRLHVVFPERQPDNEALSAVWARGRIDELLSTSGRAAPDSVVAEVTALALGYRLMSPYTSFVAVDEARVVNPSGTSRVVRQAVPLPEGMSLEGIFGKAGPLGLQTDGEQDEDPEDYEDEPPGRAPGGVVGGVVGGVMGGVPGGVPTEAAERVVVMAAGAGANYGRAQGGYAHVTTFSSEFVSDLPVSGRFYQNVLALAPGVQGSDGDGNPNINGAREREFNTVVGGIGVVDVDEIDDAPDARERLRNTAFRVLADLADDGKLSQAEGLPALAALLAAQRESGAVATDVTVHAIATWALVEASRHARGDAWVMQASIKAVDYLANLAYPEGWPPRPGRDAGAEPTRWAKLVLGMIQPDSVGKTPGPKGEPSVEYVQLRAALAAARSGAKPPDATGRSPFDRLLRALGRGHLKVVRVS